MHTRGCTQAIYSRRTIVRKSIDRPRQPRNCSLISLRYFHSRISDNWSNQNRLVHTTDVVAQMQGRLTPHYKWEINPPHLTLTIQVQEIS